MSNKFFNNNTGNTLFDKLKGIASGMTNFDRFLAVVGFFRSSGYFKLRKELGDVKEIKILVGINVDDIFRRHNKTMLMLESTEKAKIIYDDEFRRDLINAQYAPEVEEGILQMCQDLVDGRLQMKIHATKNLHAKFYLCLPDNHTEHTDGWVIMGSSNISDSGLGINQPPRYELNVAMKDFDDVDYCHSEFKKLWEEAVTLTIDDIENIKQKTYLGYQPTPYEIYLKVLIDTFGDQIEDEFSIQLPNGVKELKYQTDAVIQGFQMLMRHNGLFLADVVGLGKTMVATMIAKRFIEANGRNTNILVVFPPALRENWEKTFKLFGIYNKAQFITNGILTKVLDGKDRYKSKEEFDLIIVDEAHGFRNGGSGKYDELQKICKADCVNKGLLKSQRKKVMLLSATPLNNRPEDLLNLLLLFQDSQSCTIDGIPNLKSFFSEHIKSYNQLMKEREHRDVTVDVDKIYEIIRERVIDKVTVRRTRHNIENDPEYKKDLEAQGIVFPKPQPPISLEYQMDTDTSKLFFDTLNVLSDDKFDPHLYYARYRAVEFLKPEYRAKYRNAVHVGQTLASIYRVHMVKRLESSFTAFKQSLATLLRITNDMLKMFEEDKVIIAPDLNVKDLQAKGIELDEIIEKVLSRGYMESDFLYKAEDFDPEFIEMLQHDKLVLEDLNADWEKENDDQKFDLFKNKLENEFFDKRNISHKLVVFSESVDTINYLKNELEKLGRKDVLTITSANRDKKATVIKENFDANSEIKKDQYNIILTSDVLAEGVNLHRSHIIVNYDSPWNASRLMQRIGRVNRIGSVAEYIYNYMFYPSPQGNEQIKLYENALIKLQGFHSAFGEDVQIYSKEEVVKQFQMYDSNVKDSMDEKLALLRELRDVYNNNSELYDKVKRLPLKSRVARNTGKHKDKTIVYVSSDVKTELYLATDKDVKPIDLLQAVNYLKAKPEEQAAIFLPDSKNYNHVNRVLRKYTSEYVEAADDASINRSDLDNISKTALNFLRRICQVISDNTTKAQCKILSEYINKGVYTQLPRRLRDLSKSYKGDKEQIRTDEISLKQKISELIEEYQTISEEMQEQAVPKVSDPQIIISETFI
ncbi:MAG: DEAD/DEAH box helicase family protein [Paludibacteraceae bacterium]|nr:DEAD/DEAH box helicase family protein [Paludibacteraceae bacterium]